MPEGSAVLRVQSTVKENSIRTVRLFCETAECPHLEYFIHFWSLPLSTPYTGLRTAVEKCKMSQMLDNAKDANTVSTGRCLVHADSEEAYGDS